MFYNVAVYDYPTHTKIRTYNKPIEIKTECEKILEFEKQTNQEKNEKKLIKSKKTTKEDEERILYESCRRSKDNLYNIINSNTWEYFITLTFDQKKIDSSDYELVYKKLNTFLKNFKYRNKSDLQYVIVPELHADKKHYHLHGLIKNCECLEIVDSGHKTKDNKIIYNINNWSYGFTTATKIISNDKVCSYIAKYISKDNLLNIPNKHRFLCSRGLNRVKPKKLNTDIDKYLIKAFKNKELTRCNSVKCKNANRIIKYYTLENNN